MRAYTLLFLIIVAPLWSEPQVYGSGSAAGLFVVANGQLDRSPSAEVRTVIVRVNHGKGVTLNSVAHPANRIFLDLTQTDHDNVERGDSVHLQVKPGTLGVAWISGYRLRRIPVFTPRVN